MDNREYMQKALDFIEAHLREPITPQQVADQICFSRSYFHLLFHMAVGRNVQEYIRQRRLTLAAAQLVSSNRRILDIAIEYQYEAHECFTRAFKSAYGISPSHFRRSHRYSALQHPVNLLAGSSFVQEALNMKINIIEKPAAKVIGKALHTSFYALEYPANIGRLWAALDENTFAPVTSRINSEVILGITGHFNGDGGFTYMIGVEVENYDHVPAGFETFNLPASLYAVITISGKRSQFTDMLWPTWRKFWLEWLPASGYKQPGVDAPQSGRDYTKESAANFEWYDKRFGEETFEMDLYAPIVPIS